MSVFKHVGLLLTENQNDMTPNELNIVPKNENVSTDGVNRAWGESIPLATVLYRPSQQVISSGTSTHEARFIISLRFVMEFPFLILWQELGIKTSARKTAKLEPFTIMQSIIKYIVCMYMCVCVCTLIFLYLWYKCQTSFHDFCQPLPPKSPGYWRTKTRAVSPFT